MRHARHTLKERVRAIRPDLQSTAGFARAYSLAEVHEGLFGLPSTRLKLISEVATLIGVGIAYGPEKYGRREFFVSEVVAAPR